jgi:predicted RNA methylase
MDNKTEETVAEIEFIGYMLDSALEYGLEVEVIYWALKYMKENPTTSPAEAFALGVAEWVK